MSIWIGRHRKARSTYGFDDIALAPGAFTIDPDEVQTNFKIGDYQFNIPIIASAMDGVVDPKFAKTMGKLGGLAVLNLEGLQCKYENPDEQIQKIISAPKDKVTLLIQQIYKQKTQISLIHKRIQELHEKGLKIAVASTPTNAMQFGKIAKEEGVHIFFMQSTVTTVRHQSSQYKALDLAHFCKEIQMPVIVGNTVSYEATLELMDTGIKGVLIGIGPGAACTTREVLGIGLPQITATCDTAAARDFYYKQNGKYIPIITDGGMRGSGDICKAIASGADAVMLGSLLAKANEAPGKGYHWGMATPSTLLPRGTRIHTGVQSNLKNILFGPSMSDNGTENLVGALKNSMGSCGAQNIRSMQMSDIIVAPSIRMEGKTYQFAQHVGMGK